jgi:hypothetical protein
MGKYIEGFAKESNLKQWADYAAKNSYDRKTAQTKKDLDVTAKDYAKGIDKK